MRYFALSSRHRASAADHDAVAAAGSSPARSAAKPSGQPNNLAAASSSYLAPYRRPSVDAISAPTRTGRKAWRSVTTMKTPPHSSFAYLLDVGVKRTG